MEEQRAFINLAVSRKKKIEEKEKNETVGRQMQEQIRQLLATLPEDLYRDRETFLKTLEAAADRADLKFTAPVRRAILNAFSEQDETAEICRDKKGRPEPDPDLRDTENVPLEQDVKEYFEREVKPHVPDAWINTAIRDHKDGKVGRVGYEINLTATFISTHRPGL